MSVKKPVIICVDDQPTILDSLKIELKATLGENYAIETAEGGEDALDLLAELLQDDCEVPLVISDYLMPDMKGDELLQQIHKTSPKTIKIMLTGQADVKAVGNAIKYAKLYRYIAKPWQPEDLKLTVKEAINSYQLEKELADKNAKLQQLNEQLEALVEQRTAQLRQEQEKFAKAFRSTPHAITITRFSDGRHIEVNDAFCQMTGYTPAEIIGRTAVELNIWVNLSDRRYLFQRLASQGFVRNYEFESRTKTGEIRTALLSAEMIELGGETCLISVSQDITERKRATEELRKSEERWQLVLKANNDAIWDANLVTGEVFRSPRWRQMLGYEESEIDTNEDEWANRIHPDDLDRVNAAMQQHLDRITPYYSAEYRLRCKDGSYKWIQARGQAVWDESGKPVRMLGSQADINDRKQAEINLAASEQKYRHLVETSQDAIWLCDRNGRINFINQAAKQIYGYSPAEMLGRYFNDFLAPAAVAAAGEWHQRLLEGESIFQAESTIITKDGREVNILTNAIAVRNGEGNIIGTTGTTSDITTRKQTEIALKQAKEAADKANRAKSEFLANMSHELRTPLNAILGFTQLLLRDTSLQPEQKEQIGIITRSGEHLLNLINSILQMSKIEVGRVTLETNPFDLHHLIETIENMLQLQAQKKGLQLIFDQDPNLPHYVKTDESKLRQALINLLGNAIKFTKEGGVTLRVKAEQGSRGAGAQVSMGAGEQMSRGAGEQVSRGAGENVNSNSPITNDQLPITNYPLPITNDQLPITRLCFEIEDTGPGIAPEEMDNLFKPFAQTETGRRSQEGTGLGLPISRQFIQLMHGDITVNSKVGEGTIFKFDIAVELADAAEIHATLETQRVIGLEPNQPEYRILVVDDRLESRLFLVKMLTSLGFSTLEAENGLQAVEIWSTWEPHLIWMDMRMPVMDGYEATKRIKAHLKGQATVIIALTASAFDEEKSIILSAGCDDFVAKPFREQVILDKMAHYLGVRYVHESQHLSTPANGELPSITAAGDTNSSFVLQPESFQLMPLEWVNELYDAACSIDNEQIFCLLEQIPSDRSAFKASIADLVNNFRCDQIIDLIDVFQNL